MKKDLGKIEIENYNMNKIRLRQIYIKDDESNAIVQYMCDKVVLYLHKISLV